MVKNWNKWKKPLKPNYHLPLVNLVAFGNPEALVGTNLTGTRLEGLGENFPFLKFLGLKKAVKENNQFSLANFKAFRDPK